MQEHDEVSTGNVALRRSVYLLLIVTALASLVGRILHVSGAEGKTPFLSANDRSRWCTIRALVDYGCFEIDEIHKQRGWHTIDRVQHLGRDGQPHFYSSKPTLLPTLLAGEYWAIKRITGASIADESYYVGKLMLLLSNVSALVLYFVVLLFAVERWGTTDWGRIFVIAAAAWGTFITTFGITLNNHLPAAVCVAVAFYLTLRIWYDNLRHPAYFVIAGLTAALAAACELPALSFLLAVGVALLIQSWRQTLLWFVPPVLLVVAGFFGTNYLAHQSLKPAYGHSDWYAYENSPWLPENRKGVDRGEPSKARYAFHVSVGHHGIVSLTPVWLLSIVGVGLLFARERRPAAALFVVALTVICLVFYILLRPTEHRNYGGVTSGLRWMFWLAPMWLIAMLPTADAMAGNRFLRGAALVLLAVSVVSASYSLMNPWVHPWLYEYWVSLGWA